MIHGVYEHSVQYLGTCEVICGSETQSSHFVPFCIQLFAVICVHVVLISQDHWEPNTSSDHWSISRRGHRGYGTLPPAPACREFSAAAETQQQLRCRPDGRVSLAQKHTSSWLESSYAEPWYEEGEIPTSTQSHEVGTQGVIHGVATSRMRRLWSRCALGPVLQGAQLSKC
ncbi:hypothetical protein BDV96DRAFT_266039 [Lophiotrema nucula]|uniref:Uncharacterized protein n=1 Tax=Lophiotrema nucula TaxID=690887 RepID=A0A6A5ZM13_9PLEO|nr:hypothetical protein BDV96DRAFT_266039 [Lophiotrema nucula]